MRQTLRTTILPKIIAPAMALTGFRFDKSWRHADSGFKLAFYRACSTVFANIAADKIAERVR